MAERILGQYHSEAAARIVKEAGYGVRSGLGQRPRDNLFERPRGNARASREFSRPVPLGLERTG